MIAQYMPYGMCTLGLLLASLAACSQSPRNTDPTPSHGFESQNPAFFFDRRPFIHPTIIASFSLLMRDYGDQVVAMHLNDRVGSNRDLGDIEVQPREGKHPRIVFDRGDEGFFAYSLVGISDSGAYIVATSESGGGSGVFRSLMVFRLRSDYGIARDSAENRLALTRPRTLLYFLGSITLGDRWSGELQVVGNELHIGVDEGWFSRSGGSGHGPRSEDTETQIIQLDF
ncbi:MAG: hypothetical protein EA401_09845 [Planctomycetota bacterium]|nr:MAG: hypothetical protein EA401_09845 [Planctomycetota bacterium]